MAEFDHIAFIKGHALSKSICDNLDKYAHNDIKLEIDKLEEGQVKFWFIYHLMYEACIRINKHDHVIDLCLRKITDDCVPVLNISEFKPVSPKFRLLWWSIFGYGFPFFETMPLTVIDKKRTVLEGIDSESLYGLLRIAVQFSRDETFLKLWEYNGILTANQYANLIQ